MKDDAPMRCEDADYDAADAELPPPAMPPLMPSAMLRAADDADADDAEPPPRADEMPPMP